MSTVLAIGILVNSAGIIALAVMQVVLARGQRRSVEEVTELQGVVDMLLITRGLPPVFAERYDVEIAIDATKIQPPQENQ